MRAPSIASFALFALIAVASPARAQTSGSVCGDGTTSAATGKGACSGHGGVDAKATAAAKKPANTVTCADGSSSKSGRGACSGHGGIKAATANATVATVAPQAKPAAKELAPKAPAAKAPAAKGGNDDPADATAQCKDGTYSHAKTHQGACSRHGGVAKFLK
jgi:hypothetical protein